MLRAFPGGSLPLRFAREASTRARIDWLAVAFATAACGLMATVGADARWLVALGGEIAGSGRIPDGVPFAAAISDGWQNVPALGEVIFHALAAGLGDRGLVLAQVLAVACALGLLALDMRRSGAPELARAFVTLVVVVACLQAFVIVRAQLFSLALFPALVVLLRSEARAPSRRIWLLVPLLAVWSNLHGAALLGLLVAGAYLVLARARRSPVEALTVLGSSALALCLTPSLWRTPEYYLGVLSSEAARRGAGLWAPLSLRSLFGVGFVVSALALVALALRARPALWELACLAGLGLLTAQAGRNGVWLAFFAAGPSTGGLRLVAGPVRLPRVAVLAGSAGVALLLALALVREPAQAGASRALLARSEALAAGTPILADALPAEQLAAAGARVWIANPIDAFAGPDQRLYVDWLEGLPSGERALDRAPRAVLVTVGSPAQRRLAATPDFRELAHDARAVLYALAPQSEGRGLVHVPSGHVPGSDPRTCPMLRCRSASKVAGPGDV